MEGNLIQVVEVVSPIKVDIKPWKIYARQYATSSVNNFIIASI